MSQKSILEDDAIIQKDGLIRSKRVAESNVDDENDQSNTEDDNRKEK